VKDVHKNCSLGTNMAYQCILLETKEYEATLAKLMETPAKAKKFDDLRDKHRHITRGIRALEELESGKHLSPFISDLKEHQTLCQEGMAKMIDTVYRAMQREQNKNE
jgi:hypothetical protein